MPDVLDAGLIYVNGQPHAVGELLAAHPVIPYVRPVPEPEAVPLPQVGSAEWLEQQQTLTLAELAPDKWGSHLATPFGAVWGFNWGTVWRIRKRWVQYCGGIAEAAMWIKAVPGSLAFGAFATSLIWQTDVPWPMAILFGIAAFAGVLQQAFLVSGYREGMMTITINERRIFYRPEVVTDSVTWNIAKILMAHRPDDWRGREGRAGFRSPNPHMWLQVPLGESILDYTLPEQFMHLPIDEYKSDDEALTSHRTWSRQEQNAGFGRAALRLDDNNLGDWWPYALAAAVAIAGIVIYVMSQGG